VADFPEKYEIANMAAITAGTARTLSQKDFFLMVLKNSKIITVLRLCIAGLLSAFTIYFYEYVIEGRLLD